MVTLPTGKAATQLEFVKGGWVGLSGESSNLVLNERIWIQTLLRLRQDADM